MEKDEDLFLLIVENKNEETQTVMNKQDLKESMDVSNAIEDVFKTDIHEQIIEIKTEPDFYNYDYLEDNELETIKEEQDLEKSSASHKDYVPQNTKKTRRKVNNKNISKAKLKWNEGQKSFVDELREQYPELRKDNNLLINTLSVIMKNLKPPPPPNGHCRQDQTDFLCTKCDVVTESEKAAARHYQDYHGPRYLMCYACGVDFRSKSNLFRHEKHCKAPNIRIVLKARVISLKRNTSNRPYLHLRKNVPPRYEQKIYECSMCSGKFTSNQSLKSHELMHRGERPFKCYGCPAAYTSKRALWRHEKKHSSDEYICDHCDRSFKLKSVLVAHMDSHLSVPKYACEECDRRFTEIRGLKIHVDRVHRKLPPPFACPVCPKRYPRMTYLKKHMNNVHGLEIMTRKMFMEKLPLLSASDVNQSAVVVFKENKDLKKEVEETDVLETTEDLLKDCKKEEVEIIVPDEMPSEGFLAYVRKVNSDGGQSKVYAIKNGKIAVKTS